MRVLVAGANGNTGTRIVRLLQQGKDEPVAMIRDEVQTSKFEAMGVEPVLADLEEPVDHAVEDCEAVIFAAGSGSRTGPDKTRAVDRDGAIRLIDAAEAHGLRRFLMLSAMGADPESEGRRISHYYRAKGIADEHLAKSDLDFTIVRPGRLTNDEGRGKIDAGASLDDSGSISREDVARVLVESLGMGNTRRKKFEILAGKTPIRQALEEL